MKSAEVKISHGGCFSGRTNKFSSVFLHLHTSLNFLSICSEVIRDPMFWVFATASGLLGLAISFSSVWFLHQTGPTTYRWVYTTKLLHQVAHINCLHYCDTSKVLTFVVIFFSLVGSLNKIPISVAGLLLFNVPVSVENLCSIGFGKCLLHLCSFFESLFTVLS